VFLFYGKPGSGPGPHRHPYDEIQFIREGRGAWTVNGKMFEGGGGDIFVIKAGEIHSFKAIGDSPLIQLDVHLSPRFISREPVIAERVVCLPWRSGDSYPNLRFVGDLPWLRHGLDHAVPVREPLG
jgi:hypothetical protein